MGRNQEHSLLQLDQLALREEITLEVVKTHEKINDLRNTKISINYCNDLWNRNEIIIDNMFAFLVAHEIMHDDYKPVYNRMPLKVRLAKMGGSNLNRIVFTRQTRRVWTYC